MNGTPAAVVCGVGSWLPPRSVGNDELVRGLDTTDEWIRQRTGIASRHFADPDLATSDLAVEAGALALKSSGSTDADAVVLATTTPDRLCPGTAPEVAARLGLTGVAAHDVSAVCTGFLYGLATAAGLIATRAAERVLLIGAETFSRIVDPHERTTAAIFADGAGALVLRAGTADEAGAVGSCVLHSDGDGSDLIEVPAGGSRQRNSSNRSDYYFRMHGREVYRRAVTDMVTASHEALDRTGWTLRQVDRFAAHQANARICASVAETLELGEEQQLSNIERVGNTAAASIPLLLAESAVNGDLLAGHRVLLAAFGGGLTWGAATLTWPDLTAHAEVGQTPFPKATV